MDFEYNNKKVQQIGLILLIILVLYYFISSKRFGLPSGKINLSKSNKSTSLDQNKKLFFGANNLEVKELQKLLNARAIPKLQTDGIFGKLTEAELFKQTGLKEITLSNFKLMSSKGISTNNISTNNIAVENEENSPFASPVIGYANDSQDQMPYIIDAEEIMRSKSDIDTTVVSEPVKTVDNNIQDPPKKLKLGGVKPAAVAPIDEFSLNSKTFIYK